MIKISAETMDGGDVQVKYDGDVEKIQKIKELMESVNGQLDVNNNNIIII